MTRPSPQPADRERLDLHNACIDQPTAAAGNCGTTDLAKGRICQAPAGHVGGCDFRPALPTTRAGSRDPVVRDR